MQLNKPIFAVCIAIGCAIGIVTKNIGVWLPIGVALGIALGRKKNKK
jgi:hypothetical protein